MALVLILYICQITDIQHKNIKFYTSMVINIINHVQVNTCYIFEIKNEAILCIYLLHIFFIRR